MSTTVFCIARHSEHGESMSFRKLGSLQLTVNDVPALPASQQPPRLIRILHHSSQPLDSQPIKRKQPA
ncbi:hypothetical protein HZU77_009310 [Neisseriaceae bacterium TC5R-5]|nr:hypothetical protein [Neisseriaceae bacterium TC5R-5]